jgi:hypothetical protein
MPPVTIRLQQYGDGFQLPHTSRATWTTNLSLAVWSSIVSLLPSTVLAKPHCGLMPSWSRETCLLASSMRRFKSSACSSWPVLVVINPRFNRFPRGK